MQASVVSGIRPFSVLLLHSSWFGSNCGVPWGSKSAHLTGMVMIQGGMGTYLEMPPALGVLAGQVFVVDEVVGEGGELGGRHLGEVVEVDDGTGAGGGAADDAGEAWELVSLCFIREGVAAVR